MSETAQDGSQSSGPLGERDDTGLLAKILETSLVGITVVDAEGQIFFANRKAEEILGLTKSEITSRVYNDPEWRITTFDGGQFPDEELPFQKVRDTGKAVEDVRHTIVWPDGRTVCLSINASSLTDANGGFAGIVAGIKDITAAVESERALERQNRANRVLTQCNEALIRAADETSLQEEVCRIVVEDGGYRLAWVGYIEEDGGKTMKPVAQCGFEEDYLETITVTWDETDTGRGPTGIAIRTGQPAHARNILSDPVYAPWRDEALKRGYASSLAVPLITNSHTLGALNIYAAEPDAFDPEEERLLMQMADDLAYGITTLRVRKEWTRHNLAELKESREDWQRIFNSISDVVMVLDLDQNILAANPATEKKLELPLDRILGRKCYELFHLLDESAEGCPFKSLIESGGVVVAEEMEMEAVVGTFMVTVSPIFDAEGKLSKVLRIARDITYRKLAEANILAQGEELESINGELLTLNRITAEISQTIDLDKMLYHALDTITDSGLYDIQQKGGIFIAAGEKLNLVTHLGHDDKFLELHENMTFDDCLCGLAARTGEIIISSHCSGDERHTIKYPGSEDLGYAIVPLKTADQVVGVLFLCLPAGAVIDRFGRDLLQNIGSQLAVSIENAKLYEETKTNSLHDPLTGLANRSLMKNALGKAFAVSQRTGRPVSVIMLDLDHFKKYNDTYGHAAGDRLLADLAALISREMRAIDVAARYGGEEFLAILPDTSAEPAVFVAERVRKTIESTEFFLSEGRQPTHITVSLGVATYDNHITNEDILVARADASLYRAKKNGRNRVEMWLPWLNQDTA